MKLQQDYILKWIEPAVMARKKAIYALYAGAAIVFATIAGIGSFTANRFQVYECFFITIAGAAVGAGIGLLVQAVLRLDRKS